MALSKPEFLHSDFDTVVQEMIADYETRTGRTLQPAQVERELINVWAYRETLLRAAVNEAALRNLVEFSDAPVLDYLGGVVGVTRLAASPAKCTLRFTIVDGHGGVTIPAGTRVESSDGLIAFETLAAVDVAVGITTVDIDAEALTAGEVGNGYVAGQINVILDPQAFISDATNVEETAGGAETETDDALKTRIKEAPASFSSAGPRGAYLFYAKSANPAIIDVLVDSPVPGTVEVYPLISGGDPTPQAVLDDVDAALNDDKIRPLTDTVNVVAPTRLEYDIAVDYDMVDGGDSAAITAEIEEALEALTASKFLKMGRDITANEIVAASMVDGVYDVTVTLTLTGTGVVSSIIVENNEVAVVGNITVTLNNTVEG